MSSPPAYDAFDPMTEFSSLGEEGSLYGMGELSLPLTLDVPTLFALAASLECDSPIILEQEMYGNGVELLGEGWERSSASAADGTGRDFTVYRGTNLCGQVQELWIEKGTPVRNLCLDGSPGTPQSLFCGPEASPDSSQRTEHGLLPVWDSRQLFCTENTALHVEDCNSALFPGTRISGAGAVSLPEGQWTVSNASVNVDGVSYVEYSTQTNSGDTATLLIQQGIIVF